MRTQLCIFVLIVAGSLCSYAGELVPSAWTADQTFPLSQLPLDAINVITHATATDEFSLLYNKARLSLVSQELAHMYGGIRQLLNACTQESQQTLSAMGISFSRKYLEQKYTAQYCNTQLRDFCSLVAHGRMRKHIHDKSFDDLKALINDYKEKNIPINFNYDWHEIITKRYRHETILNVERQSLLDAAQKHLGMTTYLETEGAQSCAMLPVVNEIKTSTMNLYCALQNLNAYVNAAPFLSGIAETRVHADLHIIKGYCNGLTRFAAQTRYKNSEAQNIIKTLSSCGALLECAYTTNREILGLLITNSCINDTTIEYVLAQDKRMRSTMKPLACIPLINVQSTQQLSMLRQALDELTRVTCQDTQRLWSIISLLLADPELALQDLGKDAPQSTVHLLVETMLTHRDASISEPALSMLNSNHKSVIRNTKDAHGNTPFSALFADVDAMPLAIVHKDHECHQRPKALCIQQPLLDILLKNDLINVNDVVHSHLKNYSYPLHTLIEHKKKYEADDNNDAFMKVVASLITYGADPSLHDKCNRTAFDLAANNKRMLSVLRKTSSLYS